MKKEADLIKKEIKKIVLLLTPNWKEMTQNRKQVRKILTFPPKTIIPKIVLFKTVIVMKLLQ